VGAHTLSDQCISVCFCQLVCTHAIVGLCTVWPRSPPIAFQLSNFCTSWQEFWQPSSPFCPLAHVFSGPFPGLPGWASTRKAEPIWILLKQEWQWHQLGHMQVCTSLQTDNHASTSPLSFFTGRMPFLPPNQQSQSTEGNHFVHTHAHARTHTHTHTHV